MTRGRLVDRAAEVVASRVDRRGFLRRTALAGSALAVVPGRYVLRPGTAYHYRFRDARAYNYLAKLTFLLSENQTVAVSLSGAPKVVTTPKAVDLTIERATRRLGASHRAQAIATAVRRGLLS